MKKSWQREIHRVSPLLPPLTKWEMELPLTLNKAYRREILKLWASPAPRPHHGGKEHSLWKNYLCRVQNPAQLHTCDFTCEMEITPRGRAVHIAVCVEGGLLPRVVLFFVSLLVGLGFHRGEPHPLLEAGSPRPRLVSGGGSLLAWPFHCVWMWRRERSLVSLPLLKIQAF